jgi:acetyltransferase-like isoleucine patch superfamily enzyme
VEALRLFVARVEKTISLVVLSPLLRRSGVKIGRRVAFFGLPIIERKAGSEIRIGDRVVVTSRSGMTALGVGHRTVIRTFTDTARIRIGNDVGLSGTTLCAAAGIEIGDGTLVGADCRLVDTDFHPVRSLSRRYEDLPVPRPTDRILIGRNVFLGMSVQVLKGVTIGDNTVVAAGSVVVDDLPAGTVCAGNPARPVKKLELD